MKIEKQLRDAEYYARNKERIKANTAKYHAEHRDAALAQQRLYYEKHKVVIRSQNAEWAAENKDKMRAYQNKYYAKKADDLKPSRIEYRRRNQGAFRAYSHNRRARIRNAGGVLSADLAERLYAEQNGKCACCGKSLEHGFHMDHIMPIALGGANEDWNIQLLTPVCNSRKGAKPPRAICQE